MSSSSSSHVHNVMLRRRKGFSVQNARSQLKEMGFEEKKIDITPHWYKFRQTVPDYRKYFYRVKEANPNVMFTIGIPKKRMKKNK